MTTTPFYEQFGAYQAEVAAAIQSLLKNSIIPRIWGQDHTVWDPSPQEISNRLGWLSSAARDARQHRSDARVCPKPHR